MKKFEYNWKKTVPGGLGTVGEVLMLLKDSETEAAITLENSISFRELLADASKVVSCLRKEGIEPGAPVAVLMDPGIGYVTAAAAAMLSNYIYVPMTLLWPEDRIRAVAEECGAAVILTEEKLKALLEQPEDGCEAAFSGPVPAETDPCAYLYTSGSTGTPKGAVLSHRMVLGMVFSRENVEVLQQNDTYERYMLMYNMSFAATSGMMFANLLIGRTSVILSEKELTSIDAIAARIIRDKVEWISFTISGMIRYMENPVFAQASKGITGVCLSGEAVTPIMAEELRKKIPGIRIFDTYGATEMFGVAQRIFTGPQEPDWKIWPTTAIYIMDEDMNELPAGETGELMLGGISPEDGYYLADSQLTDERYMVHETLGRLYRTGDAAIKTADGTFRLAGRMDNMIKIHGLRMAPEEIENVMGGTPGILQAAVTVREVRGKQVLCGFYTADGDIPEVLIRTHIAENLPYYMIPAFIRRIPEMPVNVSGKLQRSALKEIEI